MFTTNSNWHASCTRGELRVEGVSGSFTALRFASCCTAYRLIGAVVLARQVLEYNTHNEHEGGAQEGSQLKGLPNATCLCVCEQRPQECTAGVEKGTTRQQQR